jgi:hypothetical protein
MSRVGTESYPLKRKELGLLMRTSFIIPCLSWQAGRPKELDQGFVRVARYPLRIDLGYGRHFYDMPTTRPSETSSNETSGELRVPPTASDPSRSSSRFRMESELFIIRPEKRISPKF